MIRELKTLVTVADDGTFAAAGERIGLTQGAVSAQIRRLEESLGVPLFDRIGRSAVLNTAGHEAVARARQMLEYWDQLRGMTDIPPVKGEMRIGAVNSVQSSWVPAAIKAFRDEFPYVTVRIVPGVSLFFLGQVEAAEIDLAVMLRPPFSLPKELVWDSLVEDPFVLVCHKETEGNDWHELMLHEPFIRYDRTSFGGRLVTQFLKKHRLTPRCACELDDLGGLIEAVRQRIGVALVPFDSFTRIPKDVRVIRLGSAEILRQIGVVSRENLSPDSVPGKLIAYLKNASGWPLKNEGFDSERMNT